MQNRDWIKAGEEILRSVQNAVEQQDFSGLSKSIENKVNESLGYVTRKANTTQEWLQAKREKEKAELARREKEAAQLQLYQKNPPGTYKGTVFQVLGIVGTASFGIAVFTLTIVGLATGAAGVWLANTIVSGLLAGSGAMLTCGIRLKNRVARFRNYVKQIGEKQYCRIEELAQRVGKPYGFVEKEIRYMINNGFFLQGHIDRAGTTLITSNSMYDRYLEAEQSRKNRELEASRQARIKAENSGYPQEVQQILEEGNHYIQHIKECNDAIPGEVMSGKLATLEDIMRRIFAQLKKSPENCDDLRKLMKYYLPTTIKLIDAYRDMDAQPDYGSSNITATKQEIEDTLDIINDAFARLFNDMYEETAWDISADISTMKTMLAKEGLTGQRDFVS